MDIGSRNEELETRQYCPACAEADRRVTIAKRVIEIEVKLGLRGDHRYRNRGRYRDRNRSRNRLLRINKTDCDCDPDTDPDVSGILLLFSEQPNINIFMN